MKITDLTRTFSYEKDDPWSLEKSFVPLKSQNTEYTGVIYELKCSSMCGSYIDLPGHIRETDDGMDAQNCPPDRFWRLQALAIHLHRADKPGAVTADELQQAAGKVIPTQCDAMVINALWDQYPWNLPTRSIWLDADAVEWIISRGCRLLISDIYESPRLDGVFKRLFAAGVSTVCNPVNLSCIGSTPIVSVTFPSVPGMTQMPCRIIAEE